MSTFSALLTGISTNDLDQSPDMDSQNTLSPDSQTRPSESEQLPVDKQINSEMAINGVFLLILAVAGNFIAETLGCKTQKLLTENMMAKHFITFMILYFAIGFTNSENDIHPFSILALSTSIYVLFILFTKMDMNFTIVVFGLLFVLYLLSSFLSYYKNITPDNVVLISTIESSQTILFYVVPLIIILGSSLYFMKQYKDHRNYWSTIKFFFGVNKCSS